MKVDSAFLDKMLLLLFIVNCPGNISIQDNQMILNAVLRHFLYCSPTLLMGLHPLIGGSTGLGYSLSCI